MDALRGQAGLQELAGNATMLFYMTPEAQEGGPIALVEPGDVVSIDAETRRLLESMSIPHEADMPGAGFVVAPASVEQAAAVLANMPHVPSTCMRSRIRMLAPNRPPIS